MTSTVIVVTLDRPACVIRCLKALLSQKPAPDQIIVVDSSQDDRTRRAVAEFPGVEYFGDPALFGRMTASRNLGLLHAQGEIIAYVDDDAYTHPGWLASLLAAYAAPEVGAVGGRALNGEPGEAIRGVKEIGKLMPNGFLAGNFAADPGCAIEVDHVMGCNMSFRRETLARLGGFREDYRGISGLCEDSDMCLRVRALGCKILFQPSACVDHVGAPQAVGKRFNSRYQFYHRRNNCIMLLRNFGCGPMVWRFLASIAAQASWEFARSAASAAGRFAASLSGLLAGFATGVATLARAGRDPVRNDPAAQAIRAALAKPPMFSGPQPESKRL